MVKGPADRRNPFVAATESLCSESEFRDLESNERNLTRVERTSKQITGKPWDRGSVSRRQVETSAASLENP